MKITEYSIKLTTWKAGKNLKIWVRKTRAQLLACLFAWYQQRNFLCEFTENCFAVFDQSSHRISFTWYCLLLQLMTKGLLRIQLVIFGIMYLEAILLQFEQIVTINICLILTNIHYNKNNNLLQCILLSEHMKEILK